MPGRGRHRGVAGVALVVLVVAGCSAGDDAAVQTTAAQTTAASRENSVAEPGVEAATATDPVEQRRLVAVHDVTTECIDDRPVLGVAVGVSDPLDVRVEVVHDGRILGEASAIITLQNQPLTVPVRLVSLPTTPTPAPEIHIWADVRPGPVIDRTPVDLAPAETICG